MDRDATGIWGGFIADDQCGILPVVVSLYVGNMAFLQVSEPPK